MLADIVGSTLEAPTTISSFDIAMMSSVVDLVSFVSNRGIILGGSDHPRRFDTNDTKSIAGDIVAIPRGRMVAALPQERQVELKRTGGLICARSVWLSPD